MGKKKAKEPEGPAKDELDPLSIVMKSPQSVVLMLQSQEDVILQSACEALFKFAQKYEENKAQLFELGVLEPLLRLIQHEDKLIKRNAIMCLGTLMSNVDIRKAVRKAGGIPSIISLLSPEEDVVCHEYGSLALSYLAEEYISKVEIFDNFGLQPLITMLSSHDCDVQKNAVAAVSLMLQDFQTRAAIKDLEGIEPLLKLLDSDYPVIQDLALQALVRCTMDFDSRAAIRELNGLAKLVDAIGRKDWSDLHVSCLQVLANCMEDQENLTAIQTTGVFDKLLAFIADSTVPEVQQYAANLIAASARNEKSRKVFAEQETEKTLVFLLGGENLMVSSAAAKALGIMAESVSCRYTIGKLEGIPPLIALLKHEAQELRENVTLALANMTCGNSNNCSEFVDKGGVEAIIPLLMDGKAAVLSNISCCINNLAQDDVLREALCKAGAIPGLVATLRSSDTEVQIKASRALASMMTDQAARSEFRLEGGLPILTDLLSSNNETVRRSACWLVMVCCNEPQHAADLTNLGALQILETMNNSAVKQSSFSKAALDRLLDNSLPAKYSMCGELTPNNIITDGFFDIGKRPKSNNFPTIEELCRPLDENKNSIPLRPVILINAHGQTPQDFSATQPIFRVSVESVTEKIKSKTKLGQPRVSPIKTEEKVDNPVTPEAPQEPGFTPPSDSIFASYVDYVTENIAPLSTTKEQIESLASFVSEQMGGPVPRESLASFSFELKTSELKSELGSHVIPIGKVKKGIYYHRALLFKALADRISLRCSLFRGDYGRAWNEVFLPGDGKEEGTMSVFIVDLMHNVGKLMKQSDTEAILYQRL